MSDLAEFEGYGKTARLHRTTTVTEKIDGTNAGIMIRPIGEDEDCHQHETIVRFDSGGQLAIGAQSRNRLIRPGKDHDNAGFAGWVRDHAVELVQLGVGRHFGEWWGLGIQRGYGQTEKRFSLFDHDRYAKTGAKPDCCEVVPVLFRSGTFDMNGIERSVDELVTYGSVAAPGYMNPEGIIVRHHDARVVFKRLIENDDISKTEALALERPNLSLVVGSGPETVAA